jgi:hypothetical protein
MSVQFIGGVVIPGEGTSWTYSGTSDSLVTWLHGDSLSCNEITCGWEMTHLGHSQLDYLLIIGVPFQAREPLFVVSSYRQLAGTDEGSVTTP